MANPFVKGYRYLMAMFGAKIDEHADPKVQIQQAIEEAQRQHQALVQQAAAVIGNQRQLEMKLSRQLSEVERLQSSARQAIVLADQARAAGNEAEAARYESTAQAFASQLISAEQSMEDMKVLHDQALGAAAQARKAVESNSMVLQQRLAERTKLLSQLEQAKMQEQVAHSLESMSSLAAPGNTPSLEEVREKIERRYANAMGRAELAGNSVEGRMLEVQKSALDMAGASRVEQIRSAMAQEKQGGAPAVGGAQPPRDEAAVARLDALRSTVRPQDKSAGWAGRGGEGHDDRPARQVLPTAAPAAQLGPAVERPRRHARRRRRGPRPLRRPGRARRRLGRSRRRRRRADRVALARLPGAGRPAGARAP
jgi:phage shock protein A